MKIRCEREKFFQAFQLAASVAATKDVKPILQNVLLKAEKNEVLLLATDTELGIRMNVEGCEVLERGTAVLPTKLVRQILQECSAKELEIDNSSNEKTIIRGEGSRFELPTQDGSEFPEVEPFAEVAYHTVSATIFAELVKRTLFAIDVDNTRYTLGGVLFDFSENQLGTVATDGRRLAHQEGSAESVGGHLPDGTSIFPPKALTLVERAAGDNDTIQIAVANGRAFFKTGKAVIMTRLIEGKYPRWKSIIPTMDNKVVIEIISGALLSGVRQAALVTTENQPGVEFQFESGKLVLHAVGAEVGETSVELPITYSGAPITLKIDPKFVTDFLRVLDSGKLVTLYLSLADPVYCRTDDGYEYVIMPLS